MSALREASLAPLSHAVGLDLAAYRLDHVEGRIERALVRERATDADELVRVLRRDGDARGRFRRSVAISMSGLFRDPTQFELLEQTVLPELLAAHRRLSVWSAGCADGSELYSVGLLLERLGGLERAILLGSDVLEENLALARAGEYDGVVIAPDLRARARWERRDLVRDGSPSGRWSLVVCRNVGIYFAERPRALLHELLAAAVAPGGVLLLGRSESLERPLELGLTRIAPHAYRKARA
jgi:chemotaxis protein methyltransferase CheR